MRERVPQEEGCTCDRDTITDGMATPGCPTHDSQEQGVDPVVEQAREVVFAAVDDLRTDPLSPWEATIVAVRALRKAGLLSPGGVDEGGTASGLENAGACGPSTSVDVLVEALAYADGVELDFEGEWRDEVDPAELKGWEREAERVQRWLELRVLEADRPGAAPQGSDVDALLEDVATETTRANEAVAEADRLRDALHDIAMRTCQDGDWWHFTTPGALAGAVHVRARRALDGSPAGSGAEPEEGK